VRMSAIDIFLLSVNVAEYLSAKYKSLENTATIAKM
jgi:hypothetical protein